MADERCELRVLVVAHNAVAESNRLRVEALGRVPGTRVWLLTPRWWFEEGRRIQVDPSRAWWVVARTVATGNGTRYVYLSHLAGLIRRLRPDVIDVHEEPFSFAALQVVVLRELFAPQAAVVFYSAVNVERRWRLPYRLAERVVLRRAEAACVPSGEVSAVLRRKGFRGPIGEIPLGVDLARFAAPVASVAARAPVTPAAVAAVAPSALAAPGSSDVAPCDASHAPSHASQAAVTPRVTPGVTLGPLAQARPRIGFLGRLEPVKGLPVLIEAVARLTTPATLLIGGDGPERQRLTAQVAAAGLDPERVVFAGAVAYADVPRFLNSVDVLVLPSVTIPPAHKEQFGRVLVEAMAAGVPVVGSSSGAIPEVIGDAGLVVPEGDPAALAAALDRLLSNSDLRPRLIELGRARAASQYAWPVVAARTRALYQSAVAVRLARRRASRPVAPPAGRR